MESLRLRSVVWAARGVQRNRMTDSLRLIAKRWLETPRGCVWFGTQRGSHRVSLFGVGSGQGYLFHVLRIGHAFGANLIGRGKSRGVPSSAQGDDQIDCRRHATAEQNDGGALVAKRDGLCGDD